LIIAYTMKKAVIVLSGWLDSTVLLYKLIDEWYDVCAINFFYGQKHSKELKCAEHICKKMGVEYTLVDISFLKKLLNSALTKDDIDIPEWHYQADTMKMTVVPNRNMIFASIAVGYAQSIWATIVALGVHGGDHEIYPDCREDFMQKLNKAVEISDRHKVSLYYPLIHMDKSTIVNVWLHLWVDFAKTWTCYKWGEIPCGKCWSCMEREEAFKKNWMKDPLLASL